MDEFEYKPVSGIVFDVSKDYVLVELINGLYSPITPQNNVKKRYSSVIGLVKGYYDIFGKKMTCWTHVIKYMNIDYFTILTDLSDINIENTKYEILKVEELTYFNCTPELIWLVHMSLDPRIKDMKIIKI